LLFTLIANPVLAQPPMASLSGRVVEAGTLQAIPGALVSLVPGNVSLKAGTDSSGAFRIAGIPVGHYALQAWAPGYDTLLVPELWLRAGKQVQQDLELTPHTGELGAVTVSALAREQLSPLGVRPFTVEQSLRWPATFSDPARLVSAMPGVANANDQANHLIIRGNSPNANAYTLEGVEIVNPNHTGNAGTATDMPTLSGGGVSILSAQLLGPSQLLTGVLPVDRDNALGGILDMRLRNGSMQEREWTAQAGLLGLELSTEGPIGKDGRSSYLANYRYSTVGLLGAMGVDLGDEDITFQDLAFHVTLPAGKRGELHLFGLCGTSSNVFNAVHDTTQWEVDKDSRNIDYSSSMGAAGASLRTSLGGRTSLSSAVAISEIDQDRTEEVLNNDYSVGYRTEAKLSERKLSGMVKVEGAIGGRFRYAAGANATERRLTSIQNSDAAAWLIRPWLNGRWSITEHLLASLGIGASHFTWTGETAAEPRASLQWRMRHGRSLALAYGIRAQMPQWQSFAASPLPPLPPEKLGLTRSQDIVLGYDHPVNDRINIHVEAYWQALEHVPVSAYSIFNASYGDLSMVNIWDEQVVVPLIATGSAQNTGLELTLDHRFANGFFYQFNGTVFQSTYKGADGSERESRWDNRYLVNLFGGKEFRKEKADVVRTWGISGRVNAMGGMYDPPLPTLTDINGNVLFRGTSGPEQLPGFLRIDLRAYLKHDRKGRTGMWSLDLQNVANTRNAAFRYYDLRKGEVVTKYQLGIIPNLSYRIEF
jgi:hypothetical protein